MPDDQTSLQRRLLLRVLFERLFHRSDDPPAAVEPTVPLTEATAADSEHQDPLHPHERDERGEAAEDEAPERQAPRVGGPDLLHARPQRL